MGGIKFMVELMLAELLFAVYLPRRPHFFLRYFLCTVACAAIGYFVSPLHASATGYFFLDLLVFFLCTIVSQVICVKTNIWNYLFIGIVGYTTQHLAHQPKNIIMMYTYDRASESVGGVLSHSTYETMLLLPCMLVVYGLVWWFFARNIKKNGLDTKDKRLLLVSVIALVFMIILSGLTNRDTERGYLIQRLYAIVCCLLTLFLLGSLASEKNLEIELSVLKRMQSEEKKQYQISQETIALINTKVHDLKYQIRSTLHGGRVYDESEIEELEKAISIYDTVVKTGNDALDTILTEKSLSCEKKQVVLSCITDGTKLSFIKDADIYSLFGNILDNALEAVSTLEDADDRRISLQIKAKGNLLSIHVQNKFWGTLEFSKDLPVTTKEDQEYHGYGLKSVKFILERYDGILSIKTDNHIFTLDIVIPMPQSG